MNVESGPVWQNPAAQVQHRVTDLLQRMTLSEKVSQLYGVWVGADSAGGDVAPHQHDLSQQPPLWNEIIRDGLGQLTRPFGTAPVEPTAGAASLAHSQQQIIAHNRFGIPALVHEECLTGFAAWQATIFPSPLCWGATFDPSLIERMAHAIGNQMRLAGVHQGLAPVLDVARDLRWGRIEETISEDPLVVGLIGSGYVRGLQSAGIIATLKHFVGYSASTAGRNIAPVSLGVREIADILLPPFEMALAAGADSVMNSYTSLDGVPTAADTSLLTDLLRSRLGFTGTVVADYFSVAFLQTLHGVAASARDAAEQALRAGIDVELPTAHCYPELADSPRPDIEAAIDRAVSRVLQQKIAAGLLDPDYDPAPAAAMEFNSAADSQLARTIAQQAIVLLRNENQVLPLTQRSKLAVVGPRAMTPQAMLGCYSFPVHVGVRHPDVAIGVPLLSLAEALESDIAGYEVTAVASGSVLELSDSDIAAAVAASNNADVVIAAIGDEAGLFGRGTSGEGCDAVDLRLPGRQEELLNALIATGKPVVAVLLVGRPYDLSRQVDGLAGIVCGFFPGQEGGPALADVLAGRINPSGRLPISFPNATTSQPATYLSPRLAQRSEVSNIDPTALFPFGFGLSYAPATWVSATVGAQAWPTDGYLDVHVVVRNDAPITTSETIQVYLHDPVADVVRPEQYLMGFTRVEMAPGVQQHVTLRCHADLASYTGRDLIRRVDSGRVELRIGRSSTDFHTVVDLTMTGQTRTVSTPRVLAPDVTIDTLPQSD